MDPNFDWPVFPKFDALRVEDLPYMLETCRGGPDLSMAFENLVRMSLQWI